MKRDFELTVLERPSVIEEIQRKKTSMSLYLQYGAVGLIVISFILYGLLFALPFTTAVPVQDKVMLSIVIFGSSELSFWTGVLVLGKKAVQRYKRFLSPSYWLNGPEQRQLRKMIDDEAAS